jgi:hypothetical protein
MISLSEVPEGKLREKAKYWFSIFADWEKSKLTKKCYCKLNKIGISTFYYWFNYLQGNSTQPHSGRKYQLKNKVKKAQSSFIAVEMQKGLLLGNQTLSTSTGLKIVFRHRFSLSIEKNFDPESLIQVLNLLEQSPCL